MSFKEDTFVQCVLLCQACWPRGPWGLCRGCSKTMGWAAAQTMSPPPSWGTALNCHADLSRSPESRGVGSWEPGRGSSIQQWPQPALSAHCSNLTTQINTQYCVYFCSRKKVLCTTAVAKEVYTLYTDSTVCTSVQGRGIVYYCYGGRKSIHCVYLLLWWK